jgi:hypothetical protein
MPAVTAIAFLFATSPAQPDTLTYHITGPADDLEESLVDGSIDPQSSDLELNTEGPPGNPQIVGLRFVGVDIPQGTTISDASLQFTVDEADNEVTNVRIYGELIPDSPRIDHLTDLSLSSRTLTTSSVVWSNIPEWPNAGDAGPDQLTPDLGPIVQEIVGQAGWVSGNALTFLIFPEPATDNTGERTAVSYDLNPTQTSVLTISDGLTRTPVPLGNIAFSRFSEATPGSQSYAPGPGAEELGFSTSGSSTAFTGVGSKQFSIHDSDSQIRVDFDSVDISGFTGVTVSADVRVEQVSDSGFEDIDTLRIFVEADSGGVITEFDVFPLTGGAGLNAIDDGLFHNFSAAIPDGFDSARVVISGINDSGSEYFMIDNIAISGVPEPSSIVLVLLGAIGLGLIRRQRTR